MNDSNLRYASFWLRAYAVVIDTCIVSSVFYLFYILSPSRSGTFFRESLSFLFFLFYHVYLNARFGCTPGKLIAKTKIVRLDGSPIGYKEAILRFPFDIAYQLAYTIAGIVAVRTLSDVAFSALYSTVNLKNALIITSRVTNPTTFQNQVYEFKKAMFELRPIPQWILILYQAWRLSDLIALFMNKKKRMLHDFMGKTVVIRLDCFQSTSKSK